MDKITFKRPKSLKETLDTLVEAIVEAHKQCPDAETYEEVAEWAGQHVLLTEKDEDNSDK